MVHLDYNVSSLTLFCQKSNVRYPVMPGQVKARATQRSRVIYDCRQIVAEFEKLPAKFRYECKADLYQLASAHLVLAAEQSSQVINKQTNFISEKISK